MLSVWALRHRIYAVLLTMRWGFVFPSRRVVYLSSAADVVTHAGLSFTYPTDFREGGNGAIIGIYDNRKVFSVAAQEVSPSCY